MAKRRILVVDDSQFLCTLLNKSFVSLGYAVDVAHTVEEGVRKLETAIPDLIFLDINLPDATGTEACKILKAEKAYAHIPIILISSSNEEFLKAKVAETGANGYIKKPFSPSSIVRWLQHNAPRLFGLGESAARVETGWVRADTPVDATAAARPARPAAAAPEPAAPVGPPTPSSKRIVITDDSKFLCAILKDTLEKVGFVTDTFENTRDMGYHLRDHDANLVFLDINLPDVNGDRACQILKSSPKTVNVPVILISGEEEEKIREKVKACGANGYLRKPFTPVNVLEWIRANCVALFGEALDFSRSQAGADPTGAAEATEAPVDEGQIDLLLAQLESEVREVQMDACYSLGELKAHRAVEPLICLLYDSDDELKAEAAWSLGEIGDPSALQPLFMLLAIQNQWLRERAVEALGKIGDFTAIPSLVQMLHVGDRDIRILAIKALGRIGSPEAIGPLEEVLKRFTDDEIIANTTWALRSIANMNR